MTRSRNSKVAAWHYHRPAGSLTGAPDSRPYVTSVCTVPASDGSDEVWICVGRTINGSTVYYVERMHFYAAPESNLPLDACKIYSVPGSATLTSLNHLAAATVQVIADGFRVDDETVSGNQITLDAEPTTAYVGLNFTDRVSLLRPEAGSVLGAAQGASMRIDRVAIRFFETLYAQVGPDSSRMVEVQFRSGSANMDEATDPYTGLKRVNYDGSNESDDTEFALIIENDQPVASAVLGVAMRGKLEEG